MGIGSALPPFLSSCEAPINERGLRPTLPGAPELGPVWETGKLEAAPGLRGLALGGEDGATLTMGAVESLAGEDVSK